MRTVPQESLHSEEIRQIWAMFEETDRRFKEISREMREGYKELRDLFKETDKRTGDISGKWGRFVEGMVVPDMISLFEKRGIEIGRISQRVRVRKQGEEMED